MTICNIHTATASKFADTRAQARVGPGLVTLLYMSENNELNAPLFRKNFDLKCWQNPPSLLLNQFIALYIIMISFLMLLVIGAHIIIW